MSTISSKESSKALRLAYDHLALALDHIEGDRLKILAQMQTCQLEQLDKYAGKLKVIKQAIERRNHQVVRLNIENYTILNLNNIGYY
jgi:hypothetical protein